ncbi:MAG: Nif3-like dinuclear metal center hexameric protein [Candidatus Promineifilaceae bacterium]|nr:Nif3-like dinuclear metal center hexameric protein [Candidatus Promineifilaceae bacterium]
MNKKELTNYLDQYLEITTISDYGPQGLQVEALAQEIQRIALAVDTAPANIKAASSWNADLLLVHHGILWRNVEPIAGPLGERVRLLISNDIHLYAAHLALDAHPVVGNNAVLANMLGVEEREMWCDVMGTKIGVIGQVNISLDNLLALINSGLETTSFVLNHGPSQVRRVAIVSGFGADKVAEAKALGADTLLTGETSHANYWSAADHQINVIFAGHYATETVGVRAIGEHLGARFGLETRFFDFPTTM